MKQKYLGMLAAGHFSADINQGALPAILPFLISEHGLSYASAASLVFAANFLSSIIQPVFGHLADRAPRPWLMSAGVLLAGAGLAFTGFISTYWLLFLSISLSGIGIAAFHPEAARLAHQVSGEKKGTGLSIFSVGGNAGFAVGPIFATSVLLYWGLKGTLVLLVPAILMAVMLGLEVNALRHLTASAGKKQQAESQPAAARDEWGAFSRLTVVVFSRSILFYGMSTFIPLYWIGVLGQSKAAAGTALSVLLFTGAIGTLIGGRLADRYGFRQVIRTGFSALLPFMLLFIHVSDATIATLLLIPIGLGLYIPFSPVVVLGQKYLPNRMGLASGVTLGLAVSIGGLTTPLLGWVADQYGLSLVLTIIACVPLVAAAAAFTLTEPGQAAKAG